MIKKIIFVTFLLISLSSFGQDINELRKKANTSSDKELLVFVEKAKDQGLTLAEAEKQFSLLGAKPKEIKRLRDLWYEETSEDEPNLFEDSDNENQSNFGNTIPFEEEENNEIGSDSYFSRDIGYKLDQNNMISFATRRNRKTDLTEYYNLIYQYENDCLVAAIEYNKNYYEDRDIRPSEEIYFSLTITPFTSVNTPNFNK